MNKKNRIEFHEDDDIKRISFGLYLVVSLMASGFFTAYAIFRPEKVSLFAVFLVVIWVIVSVVQIVLHFSGYVLAVSKRIVMILTALMIAFTALTWAFGRFPLMPPM